LDFQYKPTLGIAAGPPYLIVSGYASVGDPITGPRNTHQNTYQFTYSLAHTTGKHSFKYGGEFTRTQMTLVYGIATNGFFIFAPFPFSDSFASFLTGQSVTFFQGGGQFDRGLRNYELAGYAQDEWRIYQGQECNPRGARVRGAEEKLRGPAFLGARVLRVHGRAGRGREHRPLA
jgi:hypothetical protein